VKLIFLLLLIAGTTFWQGLLLLLRGGGGRQFTGSGVLGSLLPDPALKEVAVVYNGSIAQIGKLKAF
jgi:hypothetical protein